MADLVRRLSRWRHAFRHGRTLRWQKPLAGRLDRAKAWASHLVTEHGFYRVLRPNLHAVAPGLWRAAQPGPLRLRRWHRTLGIRTIVNLRNPGEYGSWALEKEACAAAGIRFVQFRMRSRGLPTREELLAFPDFIAGLETPLLFHCKSGADRAGLFAALCLIVRDGRTASEALEQLSWRYGHLRHARAGVLDALIGTWRDEGETKGIAFIDWVRDSYDPAAIEARYRARFWSTLLGDRLMRRE